MENKPTLICMVGLPRSGKSTIVTKLMGRLGAPVVRRDAIRLALHGQRYQALSEPFVKAISYTMIRSLFLAGHQWVICDETNFSQAARDSQKSDLWSTSFYHVPTSMKVCQERAIETGQPDLLPIIEQMAKRWEPFGSSDYVWHTDDGTGTIPYVSL